MSLQLTEMEAMQLCNLIYDDIVNALRKLYNFQDNDDPKATYWGHKEHAVGNGVYIFRNGYVVKLFFQPMCHGTFKIWLGKWNDTSNLLFTNREKSTTIDDVKSILDKVEKGDISFWEN